MVVLVDKRTEAMLDAGAALETASAILGPDGRPARLSAQRSAGEAPLVGEFAPLSQDTQSVLRSWMGTLSNPDPLMATQRPTSSYYLAGFGLYEEMLDNDPHVLGVVKQRQLAVLSAPTSLLPASDDPQAQRIQAFSEAMLAAIKGWHDTRGELWMAVYYGVTYAEIDWQLRDLSYEHEGKTETLRQAFLPARLLSRRRGRFVFDEAFQLCLRQGSGDLKGTPVPPRKFIHYAPRRRYENPYGEALARVLWRWSFMKKHATKWKIVDLERYGSPFLLLEVEPGWTTEQAASYDMMLKTAQTGSGMWYPRGVVAKTENIFHSSTATSPHEAWSNFCDKQIAIAVLGQTLTTQLGDTGSRAAAQVHYDVRASIVQDDADSLCEPVQELINLAIEVNFGAQYLPLAPRYVIDTRSRDVKAYLENVTLAQDAGLSVSATQVREETGFAAPEEGDELAAPRQPSPFDFGATPAIPPESEPPGQGSRFKVQGPKVNGEEVPPAKSSRRQAAGGRQQGVPLALLDPSAAALTASTPLGGPIALALEATPLTAALREKLPAGDVRDLYDEGVAAVSGILDSLPGRVHDWLLAELSSRGMEPDAPLSISPGDLDWSEFEFPDEMKAGFADRLNNDLTIAALLSREAFLEACNWRKKKKAASGKRQAASGRQLMAAGGEENPLIEELFDFKRIIPRRVLSVFTRKVHEGMTSDRFYQLDALCRSASFTAWDLLEADVRHIGGALQDAIHWGYTCQQFADYVYDRLQARYVQQGSELHAWHVETIYHTNIATAYNQAQADSLDEMAAEFPYVRFSNPAPQAPPCVERAGKVWRTDSGFMRANTPPLHFNCASTLIAIDGGTLQSEGWAVETNPPATPPEIYAGPRDPATGEPTGTPQPFGAWAPLDERYAHLREMRGVGNG